LTQLLEGKVAVITGGASGIGQACAQLFAEAGADVVIGDLQDGQDSVELVERAGQRAIFVRTDTTDEQACDALIAAAASEFGHVDVGVASAGIATAGGASNVQARAAERGEGTAEQGAGSVVNISTAAFRKVLNVNVIGVMQTDRALARQMLKQGTGGSIINIASSAAKIPLAGASPYCTSKAAVHMLTKVLALELAQKDIRVNAVGPGYTATPMIGGIEDDEAALASAMSITPMGRLGQPMEIAQACLFLAGPGASFFTGQLLHPAGGQFTG
jgi:NAD(P)-dependent dehydrogenase (short-subunit alcohol dehydrogenase family)